MLLLTLTLDDMARKAEYVLSNLRCSVLPEICKICKRFDNNNACCNDGLNSVLFLKIN